MPNVKICDICGLSFGNKISVPSMILGGNQYDLCKGCTDKIYSYIDFLKNRDKEGQEFIERWEEFTRSINQKVEEK